MHRPPPPSNNLRHSGQLGPDRQGTFGIPRSNNFFKDRIPPTSCRAAAGQRSGQVLQGGTLACRPYMDSLDLPSRHLPRTSPLKPHSLTTSCSGPPGKMSGLVLQGGTLASRPYVDSLDPPSCYETWAGYHREASHYPDLLPSAVRQDVCGGALRRNVALPAIDRPDRSPCHPAKRPSQDSPP